MRARWSQAAVLAVGGLTCVVLWAAARAAPAAAVPASPDESESLEVVAEGVAALGTDAVASRDEAIWDAKRTAVEQAAGVFLRARSLGRDLELAEDLIDARSRGFIRRWSLVPGSERVEGLAGGRVLRLKVRAIVDLLPVIRRLSDIADVYDDLERPRIRVEPAAGPSARLRDLLVADLRRQGFEVAASGPAEVSATVNLRLAPTVRLGDPAAPYDVGRVVAACRATVAVRLVSVASEDVLLSAAATATAASFEGDEDAAAAATEEAARALLADGPEPVLPRLLVRWARERQEGHVVAIQVTALDHRQRALFRSQVQAMRGFRRMTAVDAAGGRYTLRFLTTLDTRAIRRRLSELRLPQGLLAVKNGRGPLVLCAVPPPRRASRR